MYFFSSIIETIHLFIILQKWLNFERIIWTEPIWVIFNSLAALHTAMYFLFLTAAQSNFNQ